MIDQVEITRLLRAWHNGEQAALDQLMSMIFNDLRYIAINRLQQERANHTLQATALVNEAYLRLIDCQTIDWQNRAQFLAIVAQLMRNILVDHARKNQAEKRGGDRYRISFSAVPDLANEKDLDLIALDDALQSLAVIDPQQSRIIELRYFGGLSIEETAEVMQISATMVSREWKLAKLWLMREMIHTE